VAPYQKGKTTTLKTARWSSRQVIYSDAVIVAAAAAGIVLIDENTRFMRFCAESGPAYLAVQQLTETNILA
jgi:hypothetical protein